MVPITGLQTDGEVFDFGFTVSVSVLVEVQLFRLHLLHLPVLFFLSGSLNVQDCFIDGGVIFL